MDLYKIMGVERTATPAEIKRAYHRESLVRHPDRGGTKEAFQELQMAHEVLRDPAKRAEYDATGRIPGDEAGPPGPPGGGIDLSQMFGSMFGGGMPFFGGMGGAAMGGAAMGGGRVPRGPNKIHEIGISLADLYHGKTIKLKMQREVLCTTCSSKLETCGDCKGRGIRMRMQQMGPMTTVMQEPCGTCQQTGQVVKDKCKGCGGKRVVTRESVLDVVVEPGMQEGDRITFPGQCSESPLFDAPGDVILIIRAATSDSDEWMRNGSELVVEVTLTMAEAMLGWERTFDNHPSGKPLHIVWTDGAIREGEVLVVDGWGMPIRADTPEKSGSPEKSDKKQCGPLRIVCHVAKQDMWSDEQRHILKSVWPDWIEPVSKEETVKPKSA